MRATSRFRRVSFVDCCQADIRASSERARQSSWARQRTRHNGGHYLDPVLRQVLAHALPMHSDVLVRDRLRCCRHQRQDRASRGFPYRLLATRRFSRKASVSSWRQSSMLLLSLRQGALLCTSSTKGLGTVGMHCILPRRRHYATFHKDSHAMTSHVTDASRCQLPRHGSCLIRQVPTFSQKRLTSSSSSAPPNTHQHRDEQLPLDPNVVFPTREDRTDPPSNTLLEVPRAAPASSTRHRDLAAQLPARAHCRGDRCVGIQLLVPDAVLVHVRLVRSARRWAARGR